jgi:hypothetical protein
MTTRACSGVWMVLALAAAACGETRSDLGSASVSAAPLPACGEVPLPDALSRCKSGEPKCCDVVSQKSDSALPAQLDNFAAACAGGTESACQVVRDADRDPQWKLDALDRACTRIGRWTCRAAVQLAIVFDWSRVPATFENLCRQTDDPDLRLAAQSFKCPTFSKSGLERIKDDGAQCQGGDLRACKRIADVDSAGKSLLMEPTWRRRGLDPKVASEAWVPPLPLDDVKPAGTVTYRSPDERSEVARSLEASTKELARRCIGARLETGEKPKGELSLELTLDDASKVGFSRVLATELDPRLVTCLQAALQEGDAKGSPAKAVVKLVLTVK